MNLEQFPALAALDIVRLRLEKLLVAINKIVEAEAVPNQQLLSAKSDLSNLKSLAFDEGISKPFFWGGKWKSVPESLNDADFTLTDVYNLPGKIVKVQKIKDQHLCKDAFLAMGREIVVLHSILEDAKSKSYKRGDKRDPAVIAKAAYAAPRASSAAVAIVVKTLTTLTDSVKAEYEESMFAMFVAELEAAWGYYQKDANWLNNNRFLGAQLLQRYGKRAMLNYRVIESLEPNYKQSLRREARQMADDMQQTFIARNTKKLAKIVEEKGNLVGEPKIARAEVRRGLIESMIEFRFSDGSEFNVVNKIVTNFTTDGKPYRQYPATFHNVVLPGNVKMSAPHSEQRMNEIFAKAK